MTISRGVRQRRAALVLGVLAVVGLVAGCGSTISGTAVAQQGVVPATTSPNETFEPPTFEPPVGGDVSIDVEIGDCVDLGGTTDDATIDNAECGSMQSNYRVTAKVPTADLCPSDSDQTYYETQFGVEQGALCLDVDFVIGGCMDLGTSDPERADCASSMIDGYRSTQIIQGTADGLDCPTTDSYVYDERMFVVCLDAV